MPVGTNALYRPRQLVTDQRVHENGKSQTEEAVPASDHELHGLVEGQADRNEAAADIDGEDRFPANAPELWPPSSDAEEGERILHDILGPCDASDGNVNAASSQDTQDHPQGRLGGQVQFHEGGGEE